MATQTQVLKRNGAATLATGAFRGLLRFIRRKPLGALGLFVLLIMATLAIFAPQISGLGGHPDPIASIPTERLQSPSAAHWFGTDDFGRDTFSRIIWGARVSLFVGFGAISIGTTLAVILGITSAFFRGWYDLIIQRLVDGFQAMPHLILAIAIFSIFHADMYSMTLVIGLFFIAGGSRIVRGAALSIRENDYVLAAQSMGAGTFRVLTRHVLPNVMAPIIVVYSLAVGGAILTETSLSFLGFGIAAPNPSWGTMLNLGARTYAIQQPLMAVFPGVAITMTVWGIGMLGDALRDVLDPRLRGSR